MREGERERERERDRKRKKRENSRYLTRLKNKIARAKVIDFLTKREFRVPVGEGRGGGTKVSRSTITGRVTKREL